MASEEVTMVLATKLSPPRLRSPTLARDRLNTLLDDAGDCPLTVVCAPAGYGKTTAVAQWLQTAPGERAWTSLDALDNDPRRLCAHLVAAIDQAWPAALVDAERALLGGSDLLETFVPLVAGALAERAREDHSDRLVVVLDDYELIEHDVCHQLAAALVDALPEAVRMVIISRTTPPLRLARRRGQQALAEIGPPDLRFGAAESERLLNTELGLGLDAEQLATINDRVEGWPAGLALIASALRSDPHKRATDAIVHAFERSRVGDYLREEVFERQTPRMQTFLLRTSILDRLSPGLCAAVLEDPAARDLLEELRRSNLFVTELDPDNADDGVRWARYHPLLAALLRRELARRSPELIDELHLRASRWFEQAGLVEDAIDHAAAAGDGARAGRLLHDCWLALVAERRHATVRRMLDRVPSDQGEFGPFCEALDTLCMVYEGVDQRITAHRAEQLARRHGDAVGVQPLVDALRVTPFYGDIPRALEVGWEAWARYADAPTMRQQLAGPLGLLLWFAGDHAAVRDLLEPRLHLPQSPFATVWTLGVLALTAAAEHDAELAERHARQATAIVEAIGGQTATEFTAMPAVLAEALRLGGKLDEARMQLTRALNAEARRPGSIGHALALTFDAQLALAERDRHRARASARRAHQIIDRYPHVGTLRERLMTIKTALGRATSHSTTGSRPTRSEQRVLELLPTELSSTQIAQRLYLSPHTVRSHIRRLYRRLGAHTRQEAVRIARDRGLL